MSNGSIKSSGLNDGARLKSMRQIVDAQTSRHAGKTVSNTLESAIKTNIIPNLYSQFGPGMISRKKHRSSLLLPAIRTILNEPYEPPQFDVDWFSTREDFDNLFDCLQADDDAGALEILNRVSERGANITDIALGLIAEVMLLFNFQWENDKISFVDVTLASNVLKRVLREFANRKLPFVPRTQLSKMALVTTLPGEYHNVGAQIIEHTLTGSGWMVSGEAPNSAHDLSVKLRKEWFTLVGISITESRLFEQCARVVDDVRANSQNPDVIVMVGGRAISENYEEAQVIGADVTAIDAKHALSIAAKIDKILCEIPEVGDTEVRLKEKWTSVSHD